MSTIFIPCSSGYILDIGSRFYSVSAAADCLTRHRRYKRAMAWKSGSMSTTRQSLDSLYAVKKKTLPRKQLINFLLRYFTKVTRISTSLPNRAVAHPKKSTSLQVESK